MVCLSSTATTKPIPSSERRCKFVNLKIRLCGFFIHKQLTNKNYFIIMKKQFLKSLALVAMLLCGLTASAKQYCQELLVGDGGTALLSLKKVSGNGNTYAVELVAQGDLKFTAAYNINCGVNQTVGAGIGFAMDKFYISEDRLTATYEFETGSAESVPTTLYGNYMCFRKSGGTTAGDLVTFHLDAITDIDWTATCAAGPEDTEKPVMEEASFASATYTSITLNVSARDNVGVKRYHVVTTGVDKDFLPSNGQIVITGLTAGTEYSFSIYAVDAAGNVSDNSASVKATTESRESQCSGQCGHFGTPDMKRIAYTIAYDPTEKAVVYTISALNGKKLDFMEVQNTKGSYRVDIPTNDSTTCTFTQTGLTAGEELGIRFHYSTDEIGGNELTAEQISMSDPNIIYYKVGDCAMEIVEDTEKPVMVEATFASATYTSITLNVSAMDNVAVKRYHVVTTGVDKDILPSNGQIVITGLTAGTTYTIDVTAKDAAGNESANTATVSDVKTLSYPAAPAAPVHAQDKVRSIYSDTYTSALAHDFAKNMWSGIQYKEITLDEKK